jgi:hypothetical protein
MTLRATLLTLAIALPSARAQDIRALAERSYTFAYPMVLAEYTRRAAIERGTGVVNRFVHSPAFPNDRFRTIVRPNADTLYSTGWLDLSAEPMLLHVTDTQGRYYLVQFMDLWTETFDVTGKRTTGTGEGWFAITGPGWKGELPEGVKQIKSPTTLVWALGRIQTNGAADYDNVHAIQRGFVLMPLSQYPNGGAAPLPPQRRPAGGDLTPPQQVANLTAAEFFSTFARLLPANPPHPGDEPMMRDLAHLGIEPGKPFHAEALAADGRKAFEEGVQAVAKRLFETDASGHHPGKWGWSNFGQKIGRYGADYEARALVARGGLGALPPEDAVYLSNKQDGDGHPLDGAKKYKMHFAKGQIPPVRAFWSLTMYSQDGYFIANPINRFAIGDRDPLQFNADGSLDLYIQHEAPRGDLRGELGSGKDANWLPAPEGIFNLSLRMYWPKEEVLSGKWIPPAVTRVGE